MALRIRDSADLDVDGIARIYGHWVEHGLASFELVPPPPAAIAERRAAILAEGFPHLVATESTSESGGGELLGFAYASLYRPRPAYRFTCEDSVYVSPGAMRRGVGRALLEELIRRCTAMELRVMLAAIGDSGNTASIGLHRRAGFEPAGVLPSVGWKHGRWLDVVLMARRLGAGDSLPPAERAGAARG